MNQPKKPEGWRFHPISIVAPLPLHSIINDVMERDALNGEGLYSNATQIAEQPDEALDELFGVEVYDVICSLQPYYSELSRYGVTGVTLGTQLTRSLFIYLNRIAQHIKANTNKPEAVKANILEVATNLDNIPVWGLIYQILILQGLLVMFANCTLTEGDRGYIEARCLVDWIADLLADKVMRFAMSGGVMYGDGDKERLHPLCDYLYNTEIGRCVQDCIFDKIQAEAVNLHPDTAEPTEREKLMNELGQPERVEKYFARAVEVGYMTPTDTGYKWLFGGKRGGLARLGYFLYKVLCPTNTEQISQQTVDRLFGVNRVDSAITQVFNAKKPQKWRGIIDSLFID